MSGNFIIWGFVSALIVMMVMAAISDIRARIIENKLNLAIALLAIPYWFAVGLNPWPDMAIQLAWGLGVFAFFCIPFAMGKMGGGDVKFISAIALWFPPGLILQFLIMLSLLGFILTLVMMAREWIKTRKLQTKVPYGVSIALGGLWALAQQYQQYFNHFV